jgi:ankyrin repeat protein
MISIGITPLGHAVGAGMVDSVRYLLDHGANPDKLVKKGVLLYNWQLQKVPLCIH